MSLTFNMVSGNYGDIPTPTEKTVSGAVVHITDALAEPAIALSTAINPVQSGSGDPSPTNVRPISGFSAANIVVSPTQDAQDGTTYTVQFGTAGTVYGGTLDVLTGVLTVTWESTTINDEKWSYNSSSGHFASLNSSPLQSKKKPGRTNLKSSAYLTSNASSSASAPDYSIRGNSSVAQIYVKDTRYTDASSWKAVMGNTQIIYELAEPQTYQLTPTEVQILLGTNNVWSDTNGDVTLTYLADGRVDSLTALNMLLGNMYTPSADVSDREALQIIMGETT